MNLQVIPDMTLDMFYDNMRQHNDMFGLLNISNHDIEFVDLAMVECGIRRFYECGITGNPLDFPLTITDYSTARVKNWQLTIELYCKYVWLAEEFIANSKFDNLMGACWVPTIQKFKIHPGRARQVIHRLFGPLVDTFITFIPGGKSVNWNSRYNTPEEFKEDFPSAMLAFCYDYNTIVPHVHNNTSYINPAVEKTHAKLVKFMQTTKIEAEFDLSKYGIVQTGTYNRKMKITLDACTIDNIVKALILMPTFDNFTGFGVTLESSDFVKSI